MCAVRVILLHAHMFSAEINLHFVHDQSAVFILSRFLAHI